MLVREEPEGARLQQNHLNDAGVFNFCRSLWEHGPFDVTSYGSFHRAAAVRVQPALNKQGYYYCIPIQLHQIPTISHG